MGDLKGLINLARKAGFLVIGQDNLLEYNKKLFLLVADKSAGKGLLREMQFLARKKEIPLLFVEELGALIGLENCKIVGIRNKDFAEKIENLIKGEEFGTTT